MRQVLLVALAISSGTVATAQPRTESGAAATPGASRCAVLSADYRRIEQNLADRFAEGIVDNSAPRATMREMQNANDLAVAALTVQFMRDNRCALPARAPVAATYMSSALECSTARLRNRGTESPAECNRETWRRTE